MNRRLLPAAAVLLLVLLLLVFTPEHASGQMFWNQAASFAGTASYIAVPPSSELNLTGSFTIECWLNPAENDLQTLVQKRLGNDAEGYTVYINSSHRIAIRTNSDTRLTATDSIHTGVWTHVACTYDAGTTTFAIYFNASLDTSVVINAPPLTSTDSLRIGTGFNGMYHGLMDEVRVWNRALSQGEIARNYRTALGATGGGYDGLMLSMSFQRAYGGGTVFSLADMSGNGNTGYNRGVTAVDHSFAPPTYLSFNEAVDLDGTDDYLVGPDNGTVSPTTAITMEAWIFPRSYNSAVLIQKGTGGSGTNYRLRFASGALGAGINGNLSYAANAGVVPLNTWTHIAFTYSGATGAYAFYVNGQQTNSATLAEGNITDGTDSLCIGGAPGFSSLDGLIDEVRISSYVKTGEEIRRFLYASIDQSNEPNSGETNVCYNLDGNTADNCADGGPRLYFRGDALFSNPGVVSNVPVSPLNRLPNAAGFTGGFTIKTSDRRIPATGTSGAMIRDSLYIGQSTTISDINFFLATNHTFDSDLEIALIAPNGDSLSVITDWSMRGADDNIITVFDNDADSAYVGSQYLSFAPVIQPEGDLDGTFGGDNTLGWWILSINDDAGSDTGRVYAWGLQINNQTSVDVDETPADLPVAFALAQNYPNPFNPVTTIEYSIGARGPVTLEVYDLLGRKVATLVDEEKSAGTYRAAFDARTIASGTYFYRLIARDFVQVRKMLLLR